MMRDIGEYVLIILLVGVPLALGIALGHDIGQTTAEIDVLNGTAEMRLEKQPDGTVDWIKVEPYAVECLPVKDNMESKLCAIR